MVRHVLADDGGLLFRPWVQIRQLIVFLLN